MRYPCPWTILLPFSPDRTLGGLTPAQYAKRLVAERSTVTLGL